MHRIVVLGTGTEVGKTYTTCQMAELLTSQPACCVVLALKPIETGVQRVENTDAAKLGQASLPRLPPYHAYSFASPVSPHRAARLSGTRIDVDRTVEWISERLERVVNARSAPISCANQSTSEFALIETAGGVFSPINENQTNLDLALALEPSCWVLVGADRLGVLHDVRATLIAMQCLARLPDIVLLNAPSIPDESTGTNRQELGILGWAEIVGRISRNGGFEESDQKKILRALTSPATATAAVVAK